MGPFTEHKRVLAIAQAANVPVTLGHEELAILLDALVEQETELADLERQLEMSRDGGGELWDKLQSMEERAETAEIDLVNARERIAELEKKIETHHLLPKGHHDVLNFYLEEIVDESGQSYGRCMTCGMPWQIVRPGKGQPACECGEG